MSNILNDYRQKCDSSQSTSITYSDIATKLLHDKFLLTALELHTELVESGRELLQLKEFFSNPGNFEQARLEEVSSLPRSGSQATLDSLDLTRFSEDGERTSDERVAVLEFELRKAKETINALRANLTVATETEIRKPDDFSNVKGVNTETIKPYEQRALNFLINEYLLLYGYKLTSITFSDENENQDFEDWDDVGLNIPKPHELLVLYREAMRYAICNKVDNECQVDITVRDEMVEEKISFLNSEIDNYKKLVEELETEKQQLQNQYEKLLNDNQKYYSNTNEETTSANSSESPERFEIIEKPEKNFSQEKSESVITYEDGEDSTTVSLNENDMEWSPVKIANIVKTDTIVDNQDSGSNRSDTINLTIRNVNRKLPEAYRKELLAQCFKNISTKPDLLLDNMFKEGLNDEKFVSIVANCLPRIIPNIILNKREEVIPLLLSAAYLLKNNNQRDSMLQQLFNLKKRPSANERQQILAGILALIKNVNEITIENELLPQCWEQISHKYVERRLLVIETCIILVPYVSSTIRNSLILSMLQQMLTEDREASVRELTVQALAFIIGLCEDIDKYNQCEELVMHALNDPINSVVSLANNLLLPILAKWALDIDKYQTNLMKKLFKKLRYIFTRSETVSEERIIQSLSSFYILLPFTVLSVVKTDFILKRLDDSFKNITLRPEFIELCTPLTNPNIFYENDLNIGEIIATFQSVVQKDDVENWPELDWFEDTMLQELINVTNYIEINQEGALLATINLFRNITIVFGKNYTKLKLRTIFETHIQNLEHSLAHLNSTSPKLSLIPVYLNGIMNSVDCADEINNFLKKFICALSLSGSSIACLEMAVRSLCDQQKELQSTIVTALWECVMHQRVVVRSSTAILFAAIISKVDESLLVTRVCPALVTLSSDPDVSVRIAAIPCIGSLITSCSVREVHDKAYMQLQGVLSEPSIKTDHALLCQTITTLGQIANASEPWFREEVILPQLAALSIYATQISNQTRRKDVTYKLIETFSTIIYCPMSKQTIGTCLLPGLRHLENIDLPTNVHQEQIAMMLKDVESRLEIVNVSSPTSRTNERPSSLLTSNIGVDDVRQRMSKILSPSVVKNVPSNFSNFQGIFKKK